MKAAYEDPNVKAYRYPATGRPVGPRSILSKRETNVSPCCYLPIVRYPGLYYSATTGEKKYCGRFYYYEPDSTYFINLGSNWHIYGTKYHALKSISPKLAKYYEPLIRSLTWGEYWNPKNLPEDFREQVNE